MRLKITKKVLLSALSVFLTVVVLVGCVLVGLYFGSKKKVSDFMEQEYERDFSSELVIVDKTDSYLAHPDLVQTDSGRLLVVYPAGHGRGKILMKYSDDFGKTWSERVDTLPKSWDTSQETPTVYNVRFVDGSSKLVLISGCPHWNSGWRDGEYLPEMQANGFNFSYSDDDGNTWSEFENWHAPMNCIVAMSSLTQIKEDGCYIDKWMGTFHDANFINYKTYLTFDETGKANWSKPEPLLAEHRAVEKEMGICEIEIIRTDTDALVLMARAENRVSRSAVCVSTDEGNTWTSPRELPYYLSGDRHKAEYDETTGKVVLSFRQIIPEKPNLLSSKSTMGDGWVGWVGTFSDLLAVADGSATEPLGKSYLLGAHYGNWCDCGYNGIVCNDGKALLVSYGQFDKDSDNPYIVALSMDLSIFG